VYGGSGRTVTPKVRAIACEHTLEGLSLEGTVPKVASWPGPLLGTVPVRDSP
jgi:hypothetical protein